MEGGVNLTGNEYRKTNGFAGNSETDIKTKTKSSTNGPY